MTKILGFSGSKQSGKSTCCKFIHGYQLRVNDVIKKFFMDEDGSLLIGATQIDENGNETEGLGVLDIERNDYEFLEYAAQTVWPFVRSFSFADPLKSIAIQLFGLSEEQCYGTDDDKNTPINIKWENMPNIINASGFMTAREFLQYFGTDICRSIKSDIWTSSCLERILSSGTEFAIVPDVRFPNEVEAIQKAGGKVIRLTRKPFEDAHSSETSLDAKEEIFDYILDNSEKDIHETNLALMEVLKDWGWLTTKS
mgnify:CR=1 FL=1